MAWGGLVAALLCAAAAVALSRDLTAIGQGLIVLPVTLLLLFVRHLGTDWPRAGRVLIALVSVALAALVGWILYTSETTDFPLKLALFGVVAVYTATVAALAVQQLVSIAKYDSSNNENAA